jgi:hypothetical protein
MIINHSQISHRTKYILFFRFITLLTAFLSYALFYLSPLVKNSHSLYNIRKERLVAFVLPLIKDCAIE